MGILLVFGLLFAIGIAVGAGLLILSVPALRGQRSRKQWDLATAVCSLFSGFLYVIARVIFPSGPSSGMVMAQDFRFATVAFLAAGGSIGFGLTAVLGGLLMIVARVSRKP